MITRVRVQPRRIAPVIRVTAADEWERVARRHFLSREQFERQRLRRSRLRWLGRLLGGH
jgi:hypothetical protein